MKIHQAGLPVLETIHHPITVDRRLETEHAPTPWKRFTKNRFYAFTGMQTKVAQQLPRLLTVSSNSDQDIATDPGVDPAKPPEPRGSAKSAAAPLAFTENTTTTSTPDPIGTPPADGGAM